MDLKDFIKETVKAITTASHELNTELSDIGAIINPPTTVTEKDTFEVGGISHTLRRVQQVEFDVAVTSSSTTSGGAKGGLKILVVEASADAAHARANEEVSRVKFSIPVALPPSDQEEINREARTQQRERYKVTRRPVV